MSITLHNTVITPMVKALGQLEVILDKGVVHATPKRGGIEGLMNDRIVFDMFPFVKQVQIACDNAKAAAARLSGTEAPVFEDNEKTPEELKARIHKTLEFVKSIPAEKFDGREDVMVDMPHYFGGKKMKAFDSAYEYSLPNFYFHMTTAYNILRKNGVDVGKTDFVGSLSLQ